MTEEMKAPPVENGSTPPKKRRITVKMSEDRMHELMTVDDYIAMQEGNIKSMKIMCAALLYDMDKHDYYDYEEAQQVIGSLKVSQMVKLAERLTEEMTEEAVPKGYEIG